MPYIDCKISKKLTDGEKETLKTELGRAIGLLGKPESYLMVGIDDDYSLYFAGKKTEGAYVAVSLFGKASKSAYEKFTSDVCAMLEKQYGLNGSDIYVTYREVSDWGWNGSNF